MEEAGAGAAVVVIGVAIGGALGATGDAAAGNDVAVQTATLAVYPREAAVLALAFVAIACVPKDQPVLAIFAFGLAGLGCSALLPLVISFGQGELVTMRAATAGALIGFYQMGYGIAAFGVGPLQTGLGLDLNGIYRGSAVVALALTVVAFLIAGRAREQELATTESLV